MIKEQLKQAIADTTYYQSNNDDIVFYSFNVYKNDELVGYISTGYNANQVLGLLSDLDNELGETAYQLYTEDYSEELISKLGGQFDYDYMTTHYLSSDYYLGLLLSYFDKTLYDLEDLLLDTIISDLENNLYSLNLANYDNLEFIEP